MTWRSSHDRSRPDERAAAWAAAAWECKFSDLGSRGVAEEKHKAEAPAATGEGFS